MNDQTIQATVASLSQSWRALKNALYECDNIRTEIFREVFQETEQCLLPCVAVRTVEKEYIPLIAEVYGFVDARAGDDNIQNQAAKILAERMLYQYVINPDVDAEKASCVTIYLLKSKRQLTVDFSNVGLALSILEEALR